MAVAFEDLEPVEAFEVGVLEGVVVAAALLAPVVVADAPGVEVDEADEVCVCVKLSPMIVTVKTSISGNEKLSNWLLLHLQLS